MTRPLKMTVKTRRNKIWPLSPKRENWVCPIHGKVENWENQIGYPICKPCKQAYDKKYKSDPIKKDKIRLQNNEARRLRKKANPIYAKAVSLATHLNWGRGGTARLMVLVEANLGLSCKYCWDELTLKNISLDHKIPFIRSRKRGKSRTKVEYTKEQETVLNSENNVQFICFPCNRRKSNLTDEQFTRLVEFLNTDPVMKKLVFGRLGMANFRWGKF